MKAITFTEFRRNASTFLTEVEQGETIVILRHSRPVAELVPFSGEANALPAWKRPGVKLDFSGAELSAAILAERETAA